MHPRLAFFCHTQTFLSVEQFRFVALVYQDPWDPDILNEIAVLFYSCYLYPAVFRNHTFSLFLNDQLFDLVFQRSQEVPWVVEGRWGLDLVIASQLPQKAYMP